MEGSGKTLSAARRRLRERAEEMRYSLRELSLLIERNATYLTQYLNKGSPRELTERDRQRLGFLLKLTPQELADGAGGETAAAPVRVEPPPSIPPAAVDGQGVPVLSVALVGDAVGRIPVEQAVESVERPRALDGVRNAFAVRITGNAFFPALRPGDLAFVHPNIPPLPGDLVCATGADGRLLLGRLAADSLPERPKLLPFGGSPSTELRDSTVEKVVAVHYR